MQRPLIITTITSDAERYLLRREYVTELERAGGVPLLVASSDAPSIQDIFPLMDGLYLTGGEDIHPSFYGEEIAPHYDGVLDMPRDQLERELIIHAIEHDIPIFGICRGMQALNVFLGGSLYQDIAHEREDAIVHKSISVDHPFLTHPVSIVENSLLSNIMGGTEFTVNSMHHQGAKKLGKDLIATATASDGFIEAIELQSHPFVIGVQWHPERLNDDASRQLFKRFVDATRLHKEKQTT